MYCPECGAEIIGSPKFCTNCGYRLDAGTNQSNSAPPSIDNRQWYYYKGRDKMGPVSTEDMIQYVRRRSVLSDTKVWATGFNDWVRADQTELNVYMFNMGPSMPVNEISDKWIWAMATIPLILAVILPAFLARIGIDPTFATFIVFAVNIVFLAGDSKELKKGGKDAGAWLICALILMPLYIFVREGKTNKNYAPGILWCILFFACVGTIYYR